MSMKILHINNNYMGTALHQTMIESLDRTGVESKVFAPVYTTDYAVIQPNSYVMVSKCFKKWDRINFYRKQNKIRRALENSIDVSKFDCVHAYTLFTDGNCAFELSKKYNIPYVVAVRNTDVNCFFKYMPHLRKRGVEILRNASAVFFLSPAYKEAVLAKYVPKEFCEEILEKSHIIPNGISDGWFAEDVRRDYSLTENRLKEKHLKAIFAGKINRNKNVTTTQRALQILEADGWETEFTVVGGIEDKSEYKKIIKQRNTEYMPPKDRDELINIYKDYDIFIMPSHTETFGLVYAEAMSQGLPVIYTRGQGFDGQFEEGYAGYAVDSNSAEEIAAAVVKISSQYEMLSRNAISGAKKFRWEKICKVYADIYARITEPKIEV